MLTRIATVAAVLVAAAATIVIVNRTAPTAGAHCQIPCGIYDDPARVARLYEDAATIEKSMKQMAALADKADVQSRQQFVRWTTNKEAHASHIIEVVSEYFLAQKLKPISRGQEGYDAYLRQVAAHHAVIVAAMRCKQHAGLEHVEHLRRSIAGLERIWAPGQGD
jgi:nickel superoxide dismutase